MLVADASVECGSAVIFESVYRSWEMSALDVGIFTLLIFLAIEIDWDAPPNLPWWLT